MALLREAYVDLKEKEYDEEIKKEMQRRDSKEIDDEEYDRRYNRIMDDRRILILSLLPKA